MYKALLCFAAGAVLASAAGSPAPVKLTLRAAEQMAVRNSPGIGAAHFASRAAGAVVNEQKSAYWPSLTGALTGAGAADGSRIAAGALNNPIIYNRIASGFTVSQTLLDFGRTSNLVESAGLHAKAQEVNVHSVTANAVLEVDRAYFAVLRAQDVLGVARQTVKQRQLIADQVTALAESKLKSTLDVSFANVDLSEAKLLLATAENDLRAAQAQLSAALGHDDDETFELADEPMPGPLPEDPRVLVREAVRNRPELASLRLEQSSAAHAVKAERALLFPSVGVASSAGFIPGHQDGLRSRYGAIGLNLNIPVFNGHLYEARRQEAEFRELAAGKNVQDLELKVARDVRIAWLNAKTAYQRVGLTAQLLDSARMAVDLAQERYKLGLSSIVELSQAQLNVTSAEISNAAAKFEYQAQRAILDFETGVVR